MELKTHLDEAVSPVVGVILMVAVTVILAAVIGTFVLDLGNNVQANPQAGVSFEQTPAGQIDTTSDNTSNPDTNTYDLSVQVVSMESADKVNITISDDGLTYDDDNDDTTSEVVYSPAKSGGPATQAGDTISATQLTASDKVTVVGHLDGKQAVLQSYTIG